VEGVAGHADDGVEVELEVVRDTLFDGKVVRFSATEPGAEFSDGEERADGEDQDGPLPAAARGGGVRGLCLCWMRALRLVR
jgi:hypothetical protein